jgi:long-chain acyl-CoA synthetase
VVRVLDDDGHELPTGEPGLVYLRMGTSSFEYHGDREKTRSARVGDLFTLGDVGHLDSDGYLFLHDRKADMIITGGVNVYPQEIEAVLGEHPAVADVAVVGIPDAEWGESIVAVVEPSPGHVADPALVDELLARCRDRLAGYKCPKRIEFRASLPRTDAGKLYKRQLRDELMGEVRGGGRGSVRR